MKSVRFNIWKLSILLLLFSGNSSANGLDTIRIEKYDETISIDSRGKMSSQIKITLNHPYQELLLPLLKSDSFKVESGLNLKTSIIGSESNKYLHISTNDSKPLSGDIKLRVVYAGMFYETSFWNLFNQPTYKLSYSNPKDQLVEANKVNIQLKMGSNLSFEMTDHLANHLLQTKIDSAEDENRLIIKGEDICLNKRNLGVVAPNESSSYFTHILFILFLIGVYYVFLKYVINN